MKKAIILPAMIIFTMTSSSLSFADTNSINKNYYVKPVEIDAMTKATFNPGSGTEGFNGGYEDSDEDNTPKIENIDESKIKTIIDNEFVEESIFQNETGHLILTINEDKLNGDFKNAISHIGINNTKYEHSDVSIDKASWFDIYIPYKFLIEGNNNIYFYLNDNVYKYPIATPKDFSDLKLTPDLSASEMGEGEGCVLKLKAKNLNADEWINSLKKEHLTIVNRSFGTNVRPESYKLDVDKKNNEITISFLETTYQFDIYQMEFRVPGFIDEYKVISPLLHPPKLYGKFNENGNLNYTITTEEREESYLTKYMTKILLFDSENKKTTLEKGIDYNINRDKLEIKPSLFKQGEKYTIKIKASSYISGQLDLTVPNIDLSVKESPSFDLDYIEQGQDLEIKHIDNIDWLNNITKISIFDPRGFEKTSNYSIKDNKLIIDKECFLDRQGKYTLEIESKGYTDLKKSIQSKKFADANISIKYEDLIIAFKNKNKESLYDIVDKNLSIKINGKIVDYNDSFTAEVSKKELIIGENIMEISHPNYIDIRKKIDYTGDDNLTVSNIEYKIDKTELEKIINNANSLKPSEGKIFSKKSKKIFDNALSNAKDVSRKNSSTQDEINSTIKDLETAMDNLVEVNDVNKENLIKVMEEAKSKKPSKNKEFTATSKKALDEALKKANNIVSKEDTTQEEIDSVIVILEEAILKLEEKDIHNNSGGSSNTQFNKKDIVIIGGTNSINNDFENGLSKHNVSRIAGNDRYQTSVEVSKKFKNADVAIIANGENYTDVMSSTPLADNLKAPLLLTKQNNITKEVENELQRLNVKNVIIIGGSSSISKDIENVLKNYNIDRIGGTDRYETSALIAQKIADSKSYTKKAILVDGTNFPDAISMSAMAVKEKMPILLTTPDSLSNETAKTIKDLEIKDITIGGGSKSVSETIEKNLKNTHTVKRVAGVDRYETSYLVAKHISPNFKNIVVTTGENYPDALVGSVFATQNNRSLLISNNERLEGFLKNIK
ncbi:cell wall-binding repeat-containing protein [Clostridioides mangenotii]|uniref:cell wall-binding repeat-containing protein n=1 Tax=Metaclostridioides mangenotii TaxID=1540 RepID=UPI001C11AAF5|nr:cell wall-binding repeat-containing protein [Clostridioides mangenotii]MBU5308401.1 cell wall-binding repeat-containing protein [Clostridioides mangenotii]